MKRSCDRSNFTRRWMLGLEDHPAGYKLGCLANLADRTDSATWNPGFAQPGDPYVARIPTKDWGDYSDERVSIGHSCRGAREARIGDKIPRCGGSRQGGCARRSEPFR